MTLNATFFKHLQWCCSFLITPVGTGSPDCGLSRATHHHSLAEPGGVFGLAIQLERKQQMGQIFAAGCCGRYAG